MSFTGASMGTLMDSHEIQGANSKKTHSLLQTVPTFEFEIEPPGPPLAPPRPNYNCYLNVSRFCINRMYSSEIIIN